MEEVSESLVKISNFFYGQSMIGYSIKAVIASECFDKVIVSTDDQEIAEVAKSFGAEVPFMRPDELAISTLLPSLLLSMRYNGLMIKGN